MERAKRIQGTFGGGILVACAVLMMWGGLSRDTSTSSSVRKAASRAVDIDATTPTAMNNHKLVVAAASLSSSERLEDELLKPGPYIVLRRRSQMFQWGEVRKTDSDDVTYEMNWYDTQQDFFHFKVPQGHENPLNGLPSKTQVVSDVRFGGFDGTHIAQLIKVLEPLQLSSEMLKDSNLEIADGKVLVRRTPGSQTLSLGDTRVWYEVLPQGEYTVMTVQQDERTLVGASPSATLIIQKGSKLSQDFLADIEEGASQTFRGMLVMGGVLLFVGLFSLLAPHAARFDLQPHMNVQGVRAVAVVSGAVALVTMVFFALLSLTR
jgi:hypothetical protein